jgi:hypothetical protein
VGVIPPAEHPSVVASVRSTDPRLVRQRIFFAYHAQGAPRNQGDPTGEGRSVSATAW